jgi:hypothetical protein
MTPLTMSRQRRSCSISRTNERSILIAVIGKPMRSEDFRALLLAQTAAPDQADPGCKP